MASLVFSHRVVSRTVHTTFHHSHLDARLAAIALLQTLCFHIKSAFFTWRFLLIGIFCPKAADQEGLHWIFAAATFLTQCESPLPFHPPATMRTILIRIITILIRIIAILILIITNTMIIISNSPSLRLHCSPPPTHRPCWLQPQPERKKLQEDKNTKKHKHL